MSYADERLGLHERIRKQAAGHPPGEVLRLDGRALRFHLGTSLADLRVPMVVDPALLAALQAAALDLLFLLCLRHRGALREDEYDRLLLLDGFDPQRQRPASFSPPPSVASVGVQAAFTEAPELHPALDAGVLASWIGQGRAGRVLVGMVNALLRRALAEERADEAREPTPFLAVLALRSVFPECVQLALRTAVLLQPTGRILHGAVAAGMLLALRLAAREAGVLDSPSGARTEAALTPLPWLPARTLSGSGLTAYGMSLPEPIPRLDDMAARLASRTSVEQELREASSWLLAKELKPRAGRWVAHGLIRRELLALLRLVEAGRAPSLQIEGFSLPQIFGQPGALERVLSSPERRRELSLRLSEVARACGKESWRARVELLAKATKDYSEEDPAGWLSELDLRKAFARASVALAVDLSFERLLLQAQAPLLSRSGSEREGGLVEEYERGRLYVFAADERPILPTHAVAPQMAHLFCDVKDFTRRTAFLKEAVIADFLAREFYTPILTAAARHYRGASHLGDRGGIYLNNLLGDAVSFSGEVAAMVELAHEIRAALASYARRLESEASSEVVARSIAAIEQRIAARRELLEQQLADAHRAAAEDPAATGPLGRIDELSRELFRLEEERDAELQLARGEKLEAGIFISYGAAPEVATFGDAVFGDIKVAIAEKINESARGTARNGSVRARVDAMLGQIRALRGRDDLVCPLSVLIGQPLSIAVSATEEADVRACLSRGELQIAEQVLKESVRRFVTRLAAEQGQPAGGDVYNGGAALSDEAMRAYVQARQNDFLFVTRTIPVTALHEALQERFVFPMAQLSVVAAVSHATSGLEELFVHVGRALFKGLEKTGGLGVYEIIPQQSPLFTLLAQHHVPGWLQEDERQQQEAQQPGAAEAMAPAKSWNAERDA